MFSLSRLNEYLSGKGLVDAQDADPIGFHPDGTPCYTENCELMEQGKGEAMAQDSAAKRKYLDMVSGRGFAKGGYDDDDLAVFALLDTEDADDTLQEHDDKFHGGHYDEKTMSCGKREKMAGGDDTDAKVAESKSGNITPEMDAAYADAVKRGDKETALRMIREAAAKAMPDTKVVDKDGLPLVVYHGTTWNPFSEKNGDAVFNVGRGQTGFGAHFGTKNAAEERSEGCKNWKVGQYVLDIRNPLPVSDTGYWTPNDIVSEIRKTIKDFPWTDDLEEITDTLSAHGYDGFVYQNAVEDEGSTSYIALKPSQIKSADITYDDAGNLIPLSKRFNMESLDIRDEAKGKVREYLAAVAEDAKPIGINKDGSLCYDKDCKNLAYLFRGNQKSDRFESEAHPSSAPAQASATPVASAKTIALKTMGSVSQGVERVKQARKALSSLVSDFDNGKTFTIDNFVSRIANRLHAQPVGERSRYRTYALDFMTPEGQSFTFRISDHSAHATEFNRHGSNGDFNISVVVNNRGDDTKLRDYDKDVVLSQYSYAKEDFKKPEDVRKLIESVKSLFDTGKYVDKTGKAKVDTSGKGNGSQNNAEDEGIGLSQRYLDLVEAEDATLGWTSGRNPEYQRKRGRRRPIDRVPKKIVKTIIAENCKLIKTIDEDMLPLVAGKVYGMLTGKVEPDEFLDWCVDECGIEEWQAYRIARDQIVKAQEGIKLADWKKRGVNFVMWCHSGDDNEPREYHVKKWDGKSGMRNGKVNGLNGFVFRIDDPPVIDKKTGQRGFPSDLIGCKCFLKAIRGA